MVCEYGPIIDDHAEKSRDLILVGKLLGHKKPRVFAFVDRRPSALPSFLPSVVLRLREWIGCFLAGA
ncbi:uncharacterized protein PgNI_08541 [Pyricularia grisea]|uniref:Uncharacterized protein n=1 Tax=Pyricularia grisea TaxID=148305 RepID=A0A6P8AWC3_PYRGI|nr:uncharacterized protein PgNI_08541 [Pyricularia grisea]TLD06531.1 hypothetical protein PgNI_08541 [Pyricularia grisea]